MIDASLAKTTRSQGQIAAYLKVIGNDCHQWLFQSFKVHQIRFWPGIRPGPRWGAYSAPPGPLPGLRGLLRRGKGKRREKEREKGGGRKGKGGKGRERH